MRPIKKLPTATNFPLVMQIFLPPLMRGNCRAYRRVKWKESKRRVDRCSLFLERKIFLFPGWCCDGEKEMRERESEKKVVARTMDSLLRSSTLLLSISVRVIVYVYARVILRLLVDASEFAIRACVANFLNNYTALWAWFITQVPRYLRCFICGPQSP